jgi:hypothetical protein
VWTTITGVDAGFPTAVAALGHQFGKDVRVHGIHVPGALHLKTLTTWVETKMGGFLVAANSESGREVVRQIEAACPELMRIVNVPRVCWLREEDGYAANILQIRGGLVMMACEMTDGVDRVREMLKVHGTDEDILTLAMSEFALANGALTCLSVVVPS